MLCWVVVGAKKQGNSSQLFCDYWRISTLTTHNRICTCCTLVTSNRNLKWRNPNVLEENKSIVNFVFHSCDRSHHTLAHQNLYMFCTCNWQMGKRMLKNIYLHERSVNFFSIHASDRTINVPFYTCKCGRVSTASGHTSFPKWRNEPNVRPGHVMPSGNPQTCYWHLQTDTPDTNLHITKQSQTKKR